MPEALCDLCLELLEPEPHHVTLYDACNGRALYELFAERWCPHCGNVVYDEALTWCWPKGVEFGS